MDLSDCTLCPRNCHKDRLAGEKGICGVAGNEVLVSRAALHFFEEPCISGVAIKNEAPGISGVVKGPETSGAPEIPGSGAVFFSGCNLHCIYCQNRRISFKPQGKAVSYERLSEIFLELQEKGALNINLVTPSHYALQIVKALKLAKEKGLSIPVVYNCSGYESVEALQMIGPYIDIYLTDFKYADAALAARFSSAPDYPEVAKKALSEMVRQQPKCVFSENGQMVRGIIARMLLLPGHVNNTKTALSYVYQTYGDAVYVSLMNQYTPMGEFPQAPELSRKVTRREYEKLVSFALELGVKNAFIQEGGTQKESFIPEFDGEGV